MVEPVGVVDEVRDELVESFAGVFEDCLAVDDGVGVAVGERKFCGPWREWDLADGVDGVIPTPDDAHVCGGEAGGDFAVVAVGDDCCGVCDRLMIIQCGVDRVEHWAGVV